MRLSQHRLYRVVKQKSPCHLVPGASISLRPWCISPLFQISPYFRKLFVLWEIFSQFDLFPRQISLFSSAEISDDLFLVIDHKFRISPLFSLFQYISPSFAKMIISSLLWQILPVLDKFTCFLHTLRVFCFPPTLTMIHLCITQCTYWTPLGLFLAFRDILY